MTSTISEDALQSQQSRIMNAMRANAQPSQQQISPQDLLQAMTIGNSAPNNATGYFDSLKQAQTTQAANNLNAETGIYAQMKEQVARGNTDAAAVDKAITDVAGDDPKIYAGIAEQLHSDPEKVTPANARSKVMKYAAEMGVNPLSNQEAQAKLQGEQAKIGLTKAQTNEANYNAGQSGLFGTAPTGGTSDAPVVDTSLHGDDFLKQLNPEVAARAQSLIKGDIPYPSGFMMKQDPILKQAFAAALHADPNYNYATASTRKKLQEDFIAGPTSKTMATLNMTLSHAAELKQAQEDLHNSKFTPWNAITNAWGGATDDPAVAAYKANLSPYAEELTTAYRGSGGGAESDVKRTMENLSMNAGPQQQKAALNKTVKLLVGKINSQAERYKKGMGNLEGFTDYIDPAGLKTLQDFGVQYDPQKGFIAPSDSKSVSSNSLPGETIRTASEPIPAKTDPNVKASSSVTIGGKSYIQQNGKWYEK